MTAARKMGVPVVSYDRLILDSDANAYVSFDNIKVGEMQAGSLVKLKPKGNYVKMGSAPTDYNAKLLRIGQDHILDPLVKKGDIKIVGDQWSNDWLAVNALKNMENILTRTKNKVDAVVDSYDGTAGGCIQALAEQNWRARSGVGTGRGTGGLPAHRGRHPDHDGLQARAFPGGQSSGDRGEAGQGRSAHGKARHYQ